MFNPYKKKNNALEEFRIKAHMRSYVKDPIEINQTLLDDAVEKLKKLPFQYNDPTNSIASELLIEGYREGYFRYDNLTKEGCKVIKRCKHRRHHQLNNNLQMNLFLRHNH